MAGWPKEYRVVDELGPGLVQGEDVRTGAAVVLKRSLDAPGEEALVREHDRLLTLASPAVRQILDARRNDAGTLLVLDYVRGKTLDAALNEDIADAVPLAIQLLRALLFFHAQGYAHGDLKPANVIVGKRLQMIDLGLADPLGEPPRGGTRPFLAPEYERGARLSVAGDLFAFGKTLLPYAPNADSRLRTLVEQCVLPNPLDRPASAESALALLGETPRPLDRQGQVPPLGIESILLPLDATRRDNHGATVVVEAPAGSGRTHLVEALERLRIRRWQRGVRFSAADGVGPWLDPRRKTQQEFAPLPIATQVNRTVIGFARRGTQVVVDDADRAPPELIDGWRQASEGLRALRQGSLVLVGSSGNPLLATKTMTLPSLAPTQLDEVFAHFAVRRSKRDRRWIHRETAGRAGAIVRSAALLAAEPTLPLENAVPRAPSPRPVGRSLDDAEAAFAEGNLSDALAALRNAPRREQHQKRSHVLEARIHAAQGQLSDAVAALANESPTGPIAAQLASWLERLGRYREAAELAERGRDPSLALTGAIATLRLGEPDRAAAFVQQGLSLAPAPRLRCRLLLAESDVLLQEGNTKDAAASASRAALLAEQEADDHLRAHAEARRGSTAALSGAPAAAREHYQDALDAAERTGDLAGLPTYVVNLATAEHAVGAFQDAIAHYEESARLAEHFGRDGLLPVALINHAGLLVALGAGDEAASLLQEGRTRAEATEMPLYRAQATLIEAERHASHDPDRAQRLAAEARNAFEAIGATRQALEAKLLSEEIRVEARPGDSSDSALAFCEEHLDALDEAGLAARRLRLLAHVHRTHGDTRRALPLLADAKTRALGKGDALLALRILRETRLAHRSLGIRDRASEDEANRLVESVAAQVPPGLRHRFLGAHNMLEAESARERDGLDGAGRRIVALMRRILLQGDERQLLNDALDEAIALTGAERAFLLRSRAKGHGKEAIVARNL
ncbi:MAG: protein kinase, partial [Myxococcota bacterium]